MGIKWPHIRDAEGKSSLGQSKQNIKQKITVENTIEDSSTQANQTKFYAIQLVCNSNKSPPKKLCHKQLPKPKLQGRIVKT